MNKPIKLVEKLPALAHLAEYPERGVPLIRWGQLIRTTPAATALFANAYSTRKLIPLSSIARVKSGVVTRANAFFIVKELPFEKTPNRFHLTRHDHSSVAVIIDGKDSPHRIGRRHLRKIVKGPETLVGPKEIDESDLRLVAVDESQEKLTAIRDNDTKSYLRRGETVDYSSSADKMKGGIPAQRANIKNRKPYWYSLNLPEKRAGRLVIPEHFDQRFIATALTGDIEDYVVIDTCYVIECDDPSDQDIVLTGLNSILAWYQIELRGRTQHGEGVLKVKIPDFSGVMVLDPAVLSDNDKKELADAFRPLENRKTLVVEEELEQEDRANFEEVYLRLAGISKAKVAETRSLIARELREAIAERRTRTDSVSEFKTQRGPKQKASSVVDAFAARIIASVPAYPDPRHNIPRDSFAVPITIKDFEGAIRVGDDLFNSGIVFAGAEQIAVTNSVNEALFVRAVLTIDPLLRIVDTPINNLEETISQWHLDVAGWLKEFNSALSFHTGQISDVKTVRAIRDKCLEIARVSWLPEASMKTFSTLSDVKFGSAKKK